MTMAPCPFCGAEPRYSPRQHSLGEAVECENEKCPVRPSSHSMREGDSIKFWNTRTDSEALSRLTRDVEELVGLVGEARRYVSLCTIDADYEVQDEAGELRFRIDATLTRLSRPTELGADPALVNQAPVGLGPSGIGPGESICSRCLMDDPIKEDGLCAECWNEINGQFGVGA